MLRVAIAIIPSIARRSCAINYVALYRMRNGSAIVKHIIDEHRGVYG